VTATCPADCDDLDACTVDLRSGGADTCDVVCTHDPVVVCQDGDGYCPGGGLGACHALNDDDCVPVCGNGYVDAALGEQCDDGNGVDWDGCTGCAISEFQVNTYTLNSQNKPAVTMADDGRFVVAWESCGQDGDGRGVYAQRYDAQEDPPWERSVSIASQDPQT